MGDFMPVNEEAKKASKIQWFLFVIVVPIIFAIIIGMIIFSVTGINAVEKAKEFGNSIPFISSNDEEEQERELSHYEATIKERDTKIENLEVQLSQREEDIKKLEERVETYQEQMEEMNENSVNQEEELKKLTNSFKDMEPKKAAEILVAMNEGNAIRILSTLQDDVRGAILSEMEPEDAASFTNSLIGQ
ncbi:MotE family protein [Piscibacillus sp. B03]|uniref:MotE family protein n=1 Tax=Piscibacillus sp. B03 TaxID=3457430 RepID=UPI003FCCA749